MRKLIKKGDIALFVLFAAAAVLIACIPAIRSASSQKGQTAVSSSDGSAGNAGNIDEDTDSGLQVIITVAGETYGTYPLSEDRVIEISNSYGTNEVTIENGSVSVTKSDCANQICVDTGAVRSEGQMIICLPHRLSVEIRSDGQKHENEYDAIVR